jgi:biopolymer transport protein ExbB
MSADLRRKLQLLASVGLALAVLVAPMSVLAEEAAPVPVVPAPVPTPTPVPTATPAPTTGGETAGPGDAGRGQWGWKQVFMAMGTCGIVIVLLSVAGLALVIDFGVNLRRDKLIPPHVVSEIEQLFEQEQYEQAIELCEAEDCFFTRILGAGLAKLGAGYERMTIAIQEAAEEEMTALYHKIGWLALIGTIAPMLGLLGTVIGMIDSFSTIVGKGGAANPVDLADGISKALVTTYEGLVVAIPVLSAYTFFKNRVARIMLELGVITGDLLDRFRPAQ